jgi:hypothetical protein
VHVQRRTVIEHGELVLSATLHARDRSTRQPAQAASAEMAADERVEHLGASDPRAGRGACKRASGVLDFGKLRHKRQRTPVIQSTQARN